MRSKVLVFSLLIVLLFAIEVSDSDFSVPCGCVEEVTKQEEQVLGQQFQGTKEEIAAPEGEVSLLVNTYARQLTVYEDGEEYYTFPVAVGESDSRTPVGEWRIVEKVDMWEGTPFGDKWMRLNAVGGSYGIHGTNRPGSIGYATSNGCVRMFNQDVNLLYSWVEVGTKVKVVGPREYVQLTYPIQPGEVSMEVMSFQEKIREYGFDPGDANRRFREDTKQAVKELKYLYGLDRDALADGNVFYILGIR
ncbi:L,D-transpeptidase family protein [Fuchsiella alkaliacetigena]|uniref:L,D-transpeptidase family protein n=1 Tax=Fuchsiella alkaliacetigena TaxID=957042 RepID=UPI00200B7403|nr:L,D-transpeptidase family protein [Fuchsiella alkaliacetigena]MCK8825128.1 L,D-transpeptidase family protein [Fuchsiella alkaliacetigena]